MAAKTFKITYRFFLFDMVLPPSPPTFGILVKLLPGTHTQPLCHWASDQGMGPSREQSEHHISLASMIDSNVPPKPT